MADDRRLIEALAAAVADGESIDWKAIGPGDGPAGQLVRVGRLFAPGLASPAGRSQESYRPRWALAIEVLAGLHVVAGSLGFLLVRSDGHAVPPLFGGGLMVAFGVAALGLLFGGRRDPRARDLGAFFLVVASAFSYRFHSNPHLPGSLRWLLLSLPSDAYLPWFLWRFLREFPRAIRLSSLDRLLARCAPISVGVGSLLFASQVVLAAFPALRSGLLAVLDREHEAGVYWALVFALCLPALVAAPWRARAAEPGERWRVLLLVGGLALGAAPIAVDVLVEVVYEPAFRFLQLPENRRLASLVHFLFLLVVPATAAYAVLVDHVIEVRLTVRATLRQLLARSFGTLTALPAAALVTYLGLNREQPLGSLFFGLGGLGLAALAVASLLLLRFSDRLAARLDRLLFPGRDPQSALAALAEAAGLARGATELAGLVAGEIRRGASVEAVSLLAADEGGRLVPVEGPARPLGARSAIVSLLRGDPSPLGVDPRDRRSVFHLLPEEERQWVVDGNLALILPLVGVPGSLTGLIGVGPKQSSLRFSRDDSLFLSSVASSATLALESCRLRDGALAGPAARAGWADQPGSQCGACGRLGQPGRRKCDCGSEDLTPAPVPYLLAGKFRLERLLGRGGMGLVFRAFDLDLHRKVAVKTLPRVSSEATLRLRREARAMAAVTHPHLALIYGAESWRGTPLLIVEYLGGGTLADRLRRGPLSVEDAITLTRELAVALDAVHRAGLLHRDVKPSNIGFTEDGQPKLLDFGLARWAEAGAVGSLSAEPEGVLDAPPSLTDSHAVVGTPVYLSPEAVGGERPDPAFDVWALSVVLFECLAGVNPFHAGPAAELFARIRHCVVPPIQTLRPDCPQDVADLLSAALAPSRSRRPSTATDLARRLAALVEPSNDKDPKAEIVGH